MIITDELNQYLKMTLKTNDKDAINISLVTHSCGGKGLDIKCIKLENEDYQDYNGLKVVISPEDDEFLKHFILSCDDNGMVSVALEEGYDFPSSCGGSSNAGGCNCGGQDGGCNCGCN